MRTTINLPDTLYNQYAHQAVQENISLNQSLLSRLQQGPVVYQELSTEEKIIQAKALFLAISKKTKGKANLLEELRKERDRI